jgi:hypothetical protein
MGINSNPYFLILLSFEETMHFLFECMRDQSMNTCHEVGVEVTSIVIGSMGLQYNQHWAK